MFYAIYKVPIIPILFYLVFFEIGQNLCTITQYFSVDNKLYVFPKIT